jgi:hypothetical protein
MQCCYCPQGSRTPERTLCEPDQSLFGAAHALHHDIALRASPIFTSRRFGAAGFGQLAARAPLAIRTGASDGAEMGVFNSLAGTRRAAALDAALAEFMPWGWRVQTVFVT